jgi:hypothetical protein
MIVLLGTADSRSLDPDTDIDKALDPVTSFAANIVSLFLLSRAFKMLPKSK